jgi:glutathione synthase
VVTADPQVLLDFIDLTPGRAVLKPLDGTHGRDVFLVDRDHRANTRQIIDVLLREGYAVAQAFVETDRPGDTRVIVVDGRVLEVDGAPAVVRRVPGGSDFRSNVHAGGAPAAGTLTAAMRAAVAAIGPQLRADGLFLTGLDFVGDQIVEVNVSAVGGLADAERFAGAPFTARLVEALETRASPGVAAAAAEEGG